MLAHRQSKFRLVICFLHSEFPESTIAPGAILQNPTNPSVDLWETPGAAAPPGRHTGADTEA